MIHDSGANYKGQGRFDIRQTRHATKVKNLASIKTVLIVDTLYYRITTKFKRGQFGILQFLSFILRRRMCLASLALTRPVQSPVACKAGLLGTSTTRLS